MRTATIALMAIALMALAPLALASSSHISIVYDPAGTYEIFLEDTSPGGETTGLVSYGIQLTGSIQTVEHLSPSVAFANDASSAGGPAGFSFLRSADNVLLLGASQDTVTPTPHLIDGYGKVGSSFEDNGLTPLSAATQPVWGNPLFVAAGTYDTNDGLPGADIVEGHSFINLFMDDGSIATSEQLTLSVEPVPEPGTIALIGLGLIGLAGMRRRSC